MMIIKKYLVNQLNSPDYSSFMDQNVNQQSFIGFCSDRQNRTSSIQERKWKLASTDYDLYELNQKPKTTFNFVQHLRLHK